MILTWLSSGTSVYVDIYLYKNGDYYSTIYNSTSNDGNYTWSIPSSHIASENYQVKIVDYVDPEFYDLSDDYFTIEADAVDVILHYDDGGNNTGIGIAMVKTLVQIVGSNFMQMVQLILMQYGLHTQVQLILLRMGVLLWIIVIMRSLNLIAPGQFIT